MVPIEMFEAARPRLTSVAFRLLGSVHDAEDAVQSAWIKAVSAPDDIRNPDAWLTTVVTRACLDQLRARQRRREEPLLADVIRADSVAADEDYLLREDVSRALIVVLGLLTPAQCVAYVLHDLFDVPFRGVAEALVSSVDAAKKHASRARARIERSGPAPEAAAADHALVEAFLSAAGGGDLKRMVALVDDDCVRMADASLLPPGTPTTIGGARAVAAETRLFAGRIRSSASMFVDGRVAHVIAPGGHPLAVVDVETKDGQVARIRVTRLHASSTLALIVVRTARTRADGQRTQMD